MRTIGLLGGMSWQSTERYYRAINEGVHARLGGMHSAQLLLYSVDFDPLETLQHRGDWAAICHALIDGAKRLKAGGADFLVLCTNTMHKLADDIEAAVDLPLLHVGDATGQRIKQDGITSIGLLGTSFTMEQAFYVNRLRQSFDVDVIVPEAQDRATVHRVIYDELCQGRVLDSSRTRYQDIIDRLVARGAQAIILGCTEIGLLLGANDADVPLYDTTAIHADAAVSRALGDATMVGG